MLQRNRTRPSQPPNRARRRPGKFTVLALALALALVALVWGVVPSHAAKPAAAKPAAPAHTHGRVTNAQRLAAAKRAAALLANKATSKAPIGPGSTPDYFGTTPNYANSPLPAGPIGTIVVLHGGYHYTGAVKVRITDVNWSFGKGATAKAKVVRGVIKSITVTKGGANYTAPTVTISGHGHGATARAVLNSAKAKGGIKKFVDALPGLGRTAANARGQYIPVAVADTTTFPGSDYYEIALVQYREKLSRNLAPTTLRGYVQIETPANRAQSKHFPLTYPNGTAITNAAGQPVFGVDSPQYLGPTIVAQRNRAVRVKFTNYLPTGTAGNLFLPVDTTIMGAGTGPNGGSYTQNRATLHLHGGATPWISDGTPYQWTAPGAEVTSYKRGDSVAFVPDMWFNAQGAVVPAGTAGATNDPGVGSLTFYYTNEQSARLMFYHDHTDGLTRLNVYAGEAAPFVLQDPVEQKMITGGTIGSTKVAAGTIPATQIPLVIQDKTFVPKAKQLAHEDPTWNTATWGGFSSLWMPHVYMPNQNPADSQGVNAMGRWDYNSWFYPPMVPQTFGPVANPLAGTTALEGPYNPGTPTPSIVPESFMDTPLVNGVAYPFLNVGRHAYRFRILNASDDRTLNLQLYYAKTNAPMWKANGTLNNANAGEVPMVAAAVGKGLPASWPTDGRDGGVPSPKAVGPSMVQIGNEAGFLPNVAVLKNTPVGYEYFRRTITVLNVTHHTLLLGPAERADVIIDFSKVPAGAKLILYNDAPAPMPGYDSRLDYYTGDPDQTSSGGAPTTIAGYGPDTRTIMQFRVSGRAAKPYSVAKLQTALPAAYGASQPKPIVPEAAYNKAFGTSYTNHYMHVIDSSLTFTPDGASEVNSVDVTNGGSGYIAPVVTFTGGGVGTGAAATATVSGGVVTALTITNHGTGYNATPTVTISGGGGTGATATATIVGGVVDTLTLGAGGTGFTTPAVTFTGGSGSGAAAAATVTGGVVTAITVTDPGVGYTTLPNVVIAQTGGSGATATASYSLTLPQQEKAVIEQFDTDYGRMNAVLGTGLGNGGASTGTATPYSYDDAPTDFILDSSNATQIGALNDGTQIWRVDHQGVDTHAIHFHLFNVQVINRVAIDGTLTPPDANELGWKETVRMNPGQDVILAVRASVMALPWKLGDSVRLLEPSMKATDTFTDANGVTVANSMQDYGWEYVWHCHLLGHEENDMMRPMVFEVAPAAPDTLTAVGSTATATLTWVDHATEPAATMYTVERATDPTFTTGVTDIAVNTATATGYVDTGLTAGTYYYRVRAEDKAAYSPWWPVLPPTGTPVSVVVP
jgi:FtsP/CotA-like multicopper oxidase with cupredoxin domain